MNAQTQFIEFHKFDADELASRIEQVMLTYQAATLPFAPMFYDDRVSRSQVHVGDVEAWDQEHGRNFKKEVLETREELVEGSSVYASLRDIMEVPNGKFSSLPHFYVEKKAYSLAELLDVHAKALEEGRDLIRPWIEKGGPTQQPVLNYALGSTKAEQAAAYEVFAELVEATYRAELVEKNKAETEARIQAAIAERRRIAAEEEAARLRREEEEARAAVLAEGDSILAQLAAEQAARKHEQPKRQPSKPALLNAPRQPRQPLNWPPNWKAVLSVLTRWSFSPPCSLASWQRPNLMRTKLTPA